MNSKTAKINTTLRARKETKVTLTVEDGRTRQGQIIEIADEALGENIERIVGVVSNHVERMLGNVWERNVDEG